MVFSQAVISFRFCTSQQNHIKKIEALKAFEWSVSIA